MAPERVAVAMSGGVDSSVAAALLLTQGYDVVGLTMLVSPPEANGGVSDASQAGAVADARRVASLLGIRHHLVDLRQDFQRAVIGPFCEEYARGRTPNPCVLCNSYIKFGTLLQRARRLGASRLATGHYARVGRDEMTGRWVLRRGVDTAKDQSYTLFGLRQEQLARALFPLGEMRKAETRAEAVRLGLPVSQRPESQQICFVSGRSYGDWLSRWRPEAARPGPIVDPSGRQIGRHRGIAFYTVGQRHGLRVAGGKVLYVVGMDASRNQVVVGGEAELLARGLVMREVNYVGLADLSAGGRKLRAKIRSAARPAACLARPEGDGVVLQFPRRQRAVTPGQAAVCYDGEAVALGGIIESAR